MKKLFLVSSLLFFAGSSFGQNYVKMLGETNEWYVWEYREYSCITDLYKTTKDTIVDSIVYKRIDLHRTYLQGQSEFIGLIREDTVSRKVYLRRCDYWSYPKICDTFEILLYDFNKSVGDTVSITSGIFGDSCTFILDSIFTDTTITSYRIFRLHATKPPNYWPVMWIEGIGSFAGLYASTNPEFPLAPSGSALLCAFRNNLKTFTNPKPNYYGKCIINGIEEKAPSNLTIFPNPAQTHISIRTKGAYSSQSVQIINCKGQNVFSDNDFRGNSIDISTLPNGLYLLKLCNADNCLSRAFVVER